MASTCYPRRIYLVRHGESVWNAEKRISGQGNPPLSEVGRQQAAALAQVLCNVPLTAVYTSTLRRTLETAYPVAANHGLPIQRRADLCEICLGELQGRYRDERDPAAQALWQHWQADKDQMRLPGGETFIEFEQRILCCWETICGANAGGSPLIIGHRSTNRVILGAIMGWPHAQAKTLPIRNKYLYEIIPGPQPAIATIRLDEGKIGHRYAEFRT
ncbi:MAG: histidine phosphatase family protein [Caldilineaceae bacterium]